MARAQGRRKRKREGKAEASGSVNAHNVAQKAGKRKTRSVSWEEEVPVSWSVRERKAVDRFVPGPQPNEKVRKPKVFSIKQGRGTKLRDLPNVVFNLSKGKADEHLQVLHTILYGRKSNVYSQKKNILQFSGFVWAENEEKERAKVKEQINKCKKQRLLLLCELLDIPDMKATTKKEEVSAKLLEFLESPHVTRSVEIAENEKRDRKQKSIKESSQKAHGKGKVKVSRKPPPEPTEEEMRRVIIGWANEIDLENTILGELFGRLGDHFEMDLRHRKKDVWHILAGIFFEGGNQSGDADDSGGEDAARSEEDTGNKDEEGSGEDSGEEEEDAEGSGEDSGEEEEDAEGSGEDDAGEEEDDTEGSGEDSGEEEEDAEGSGEDDAGAEEDAEGSGEEDAEGSGEDDAREEEEDAEGSGEDDAGEEDAEGSDEDEEDAERSDKDDAGEEEDAEGSHEVSVE